MDRMTFQIISLATIVCLVAARALLLWFTIRVNAFKIAHWSDLWSVAGAALFVLLLFREARLIALPIPASMDTMIVNSGMIHRLGAAIAGVGILIFVLALLSFGNSWRVGIDTRTPGPLITSGLFAFSRNPIFLFMDLYLAGTFLLNGRLVFLLIAFAGILGLHRQILREERFLSGHHGEAYQKYCARTPRYFRFFLP